MSKALPGNNKTFDVMTMTFYDVIFSFRLRLGRKRYKLGTSFCLKFGIGEIFRC